MRILHVVTLVTPEAAFGGPVTVARNQAAELARRGHDVTIVATSAGFDSPRLETSAGVTELLFRARRFLPGTGFSGLSSLALLRWVRRHAADFDLVHVHLARDLVTLPALLLAARAVPVVAQTHGMVDASSHILARLFDRPLTIRALRTADHVFYLTSKEHADLQSLGVSVDQLALLANGVPLPERSGVERRNLVLFVGRLHPRKNAPLFAQAAIEVARNRPEWRFEIIGPDEGDAGAVVGLLEDSDVDDRVEYLGAMSSAGVSARLMTARMFVLPSENEPFPMSVLEAMAAGLPVVITPTCGLADYVEQYGAGVITSPDTQSVITAMSKILDDPKARHTMSMRGQQLVEDRLSMTAVGHVLETIYQDTCR